MPDEFEDSATTGSLQDEIRPIAQRLFELTVKRGAMESGYDGTWGSQFVAGRIKIWKTA